MITGNIKSQIDQIWNAFWSGGISNPLEVIEQITYLLFLRRLDDLHTLEENKSARLKKPMERRVFPADNDPKGRPYEDLRWSRFKHFAPGDMYAVLGEHVFPFLRNELARNHGGDESTFGLFLTFLLNGPHGKSEIARHRKTSAGQHTISQDGLGSIRFPLPPLALQAAFARRIAAVESSKTTYTASLAGLDALFGSLQHRAFREEQ